MAKQIDFVQNQSIALKAYYLDKIESIPISIKKLNNSTTLLQVKQPETGLYRLDFSEGISTDIVINTGIEDSIYIEINNKTIISSSIEQQAFGIFKEVLAEKSIASEKYNEKRITISAVDPFYYRKKELIKLRTDSTKEFYGDKLKECLIEYNKTFTYKYLRPLAAIPTRLSYPKGYELYDNHHAYYHVHLFDSIPLENKEIGNNPLFKDILSNYLNNFFGEFTEDYRLAANQILPRCKDAAIRDFLLNKIMLHLYAKNEYDLIKELFAKYYDGCIDNIDSKTIKDILESPLVANSQISDFVLYNQINQEATSLAKAVSDKPNLILFWRDDCSHCLETISIMNAQPAKYAKYNVVTVLLSEKPQSKTVAVSSRWVNLYCGNSLSEILSTLKIRKTPFIIETNKALKISQIYTSYESIKF